ncbi:porin family protein [Teredinibacter turnerae]|uniref:porin family protein n=1 Tax=Teredinibacter turnerae TaxID=2426 RepID=UPI00040245C2|nr:porin family protein [Teredinibacter turnerae]
MRIFIIPAVMLFALPTYADNLSGFYAGGNANFIDGNATLGAGNDVEFRSIEAFGGYKLNGWVGGETRTGLGLSGESYSTGTGDAQQNIELGIDYYQSIYYRVEKANQVAKLYGLVGATFLQWGRDVDYMDGSTLEDSYTETGFSYGLGVGFVMNENTNLNFEYRQLINTDTVEFTVINVGFDFRF